MKADELEADCTYRLKKDADGHGIGTRVVFKWMSENGKYAVIHAEGEPDMQSMFMIEPAALEHGGDRGVIS